jgi:hypothetical protein
MPRIAASDCWPAAVDSATSPTCSRSLAAMGRGGGAAGHKAVLARTGRQAAYLFKKSTAVVGHARIVGERACASPHEHAIYEIFQQSTPVG